MKNIIRYICKKNADIADYKKRERLFFLINQPQIEHTRGDDSIVGLDGETY